MGWVIFTDQNKLLTSKLFRSKQNAKEYILTCLHKYWNHKLIKESKNGYQVLSHEYIDSVVTKTKYIDGHDWICTRKMRTQKLEAEYRVVRQVWETEEGVEVRND